MFKWGIMGGGSISSQFAKGISFLKDAEVYALASVSGKNPYGIDAEKYYESYEELAEDPEIDAVYVGTIHPLHLSCVKKCLKARKPVLCEKPVTINSREFQELTDLAEKNQTFLMEAVWSRYLPAVRHMKKLLMEGDYGKIHYMNITFGYRADKSVRRLFEAALGGGALLDIGVYGVNLAEYWMGETPSGMHCWADRNDEAVDMETSVQFSYQSGAVIDMMFSFKHNLPNCAYIITDRAEFQIPYFWRPDTVIQYSPNADFQTDTLKSRELFPIECNGYQYEAQEVMRCVREGKLESPDMPWSTSRNIMKQMDEIRKQCGVKYPQDER